MINPQGLELPMSRIDFHGPKDVRAIEVLLYLIYSKFKFIYSNLFSLLTVIKKQIDLCFELNWQSLPSSKTGTGNSYNFHIDHSLKQLGHGQTWYLHQL